MRNKTIIKKKYLKGCRSSRNSTNRLYGYKKVSAAKICKSMGL